MGTTPLLVATLVVVLLLLLSDQIPARDREEREGKKATGLTKYADEHRLHSYEDSSQDRGGENDPALEVRVWQGCSRFQ